MWRDGPRDYIPWESTHGNVGMDLKSEVRVWGRMEWEMGVICQKQSEKKDGERQRKRNE